MTLERRLQRAHVVVAKKAVQEWVGQGSLSNFEAWPSVVSFSPKGYEKQ